jgi:exopolysaccharide production protein ExoY
MPHTECRHVDHHHRLHGCDTSCATISYQRRHNIYSRSLKRVVDILVSILALLFFLPLMTLIYLAVCSDGGPGLFIHKRVGRSGREFGCLKFRTMIVNAENKLTAYLASDCEAREEWEHHRKLKHDPRITRLGRVLRTTSADELPQLFNVLFGDMSIVGPRPVTRPELQKYGSGSSAYLSVRPGITGLWQVSGRNDASYEYRVRLDEQYAERMSISFDILLMMKTVTVVIRRNGAY